MQAVNPYTAQPVASYEDHDYASVIGMLEKAQACFTEWRTSEFSRRSELLRNAADLLRERATTLAQLMAVEMGKPIGEGESEAEKCAWVCDYYAEHGPQFLVDEHLASAATTSYVSYQPLGTVLAVMPWNFPFWQVFRFAAPTLMAGNAGLLKHASNVPGCALAIEKIFRDAGAPEGLFQSALIPSAMVEQVIQHPLVAAVTLTGSTPAGRNVASAAGACLKRSVLELGGSDPYIVLEDADLDATAKACVTSRLINSGQSCIAAKRFVVVESVREAFEERVVALMNRAVMGDPLDENTDVGPMARHDLRDELHDQVTQSVEKGARVLLGGAVPKHPGALYPPTVLTDVEPSMPAYDEELFGPVAAIISVADEAEAIRVANDTAFGLGAAVFTKDTCRGERIARDELEAGCCFVNDFVRSDPRLPFGGVKESGFGRELARHGILEFVNAKTVYVA